MGGRSGVKRSRKGKQYELYSEKTTIEDVVGNITVLRTKFEQKKRIKKKKK